MNPYAMLNSGRLSGKRVCTGSHILKYYTTPQCWSVQANVCMISEWALTAAVSVYFGA